jgi:hypothetical protein
MSIHSFGCLVEWSVPFLWRTAMDNVRFIDHAVVWTTLSPSIHVKSYSSKFVAPQQLSLCTVMTSLGWRNTEMNHGIVKFDVSRVWWWWSRTGRSNCILRSFSTAAHCRLRSLIWGGIALHHSLSGCVCRILGHYVWTKLSRRCRYGSLLCSVMNANEHLFSFNAATKSALEIKQ